MIRAIRERWRILAFLFLTSFRFGSFLMFISISMISGPFAFEIIIVGLPFIVGSFSFRLTFVVIVILICWMIHFQVNSAFGNDRSSFAKLILSLIILFRLKMIIACFFT